MLVHRFLYARSYSESFLKPRPTVTTANRLSSDGTWNFTYDNEGNLSRKDHVSTSYYWTCDHGNKNELLRARYYSNLGVLQKEVNYKYDALGNRIQKDYITGGATTVTKFALDGWNPAKAGSLGNSAWDVFADLDSGNALTMRYLRTDNIDEVFAEIGATAYWTLTNHQNSSIRSVNTPSVVW